MPRYRRKANQMSKKRESTEEQLECADTDLVADIPIKTEVLDIEETMDASLPDITVERHESVDELRKVLNLPVTNIHRQPLTIKAEESCFFISSPLNNSLGFPNIIMQAAPNVCPQSFIPSSQSSYQIQVANSDDTILGMPALPDDIGETGRVNQYNVNAMKREQKCSVIEMPPQNTIQSQIVIKQVYRAEADHHPLTQVCNTSNSSPLLNPSFSVSGSQSISDFKKDQYSAMVKKELREKIRKKHHHVEMKQKIWDKKELTLNIPHFKSVKYDPDLHFLLSLMPFLKSLSPSLRHKARAQIKEMVVEPGQSTG